MLFLGNREKTSVSQTVFTSHVNILNPSQYVRGISVLLEMVLTEIAGEKQNWYAWGLSACIDVNKLTLETGTERLLRGNVAATFVALNCYSGCQPERYEKDYAIFYQSFPSFTDGDRSVHDFFWSLQQIVSRATDARQGPKDFRKTILIFSLLRDGMKNHL